MSIDTIYHTRILGCPVTETFVWPHRVTVVRHTLPIVYDNHLLPNYTNKRFNNWKKRYTWDSESRYIPSYFPLSTRKYFTNWS